MELSGDERKLYLKKIPGSYLDPETKAVIKSDSFELTDSYMSVVDDVIMIENNSSSNQDEGEVVDLGNCSVYKGDRLTGGLLRNLFGRTVILFICICVSKIEARE